MEKFGRTYEITFKRGVLKKIGSFSEPEFYEEIVISYPLTTNFAISRGVSSQTSTAFLSIFGLAQTTREKLHKDRYNVDDYIQVEVRAGYDNENSLIFKGNIQECQSYKDSGSTEFRTDIEAYDGGLGVYLGEDNNSFPAGIFDTAVIETLTNNMPEIRVGAISPKYESSTSLRPRMFSKKTYSNLMMVTSGNMFIDLCRLYAIDNDEVIDGNIDILDLGNTLLGSPRRENGTIKIETIFEPRVIVGQWIEIKSSTLPYLNGTFKILGVSHDGIISGSKCGSMITSIDLFIGSQVFRRVEKRNV